MLAMQVGNLTGELRGVDLPLHLQTPVLPLLIAGPAVAAKRVAVAALVSVLKQPGKSSD